MNGTGQHDFDSHHRQILKMATAVTGNVWVRTVQITRAEDMVRWGSLTRVSRSQFRLTERGFLARQNLVQS